MALLPTLLQQKSFSEFLTERILGKAGLGRTTFDLAQAKEFGMVEGYFPKGEHSTTLVPSSAYVAEEFPPNHGTLQGAAGLHSCAQDMIRWLKVFLRDQEDSISSNTRDLQQMLEEIKKPRIVTQKSTDWPEISIPLYGLGLSSYNYRGHEIVEHGGYERGYHSQMSHLPKDGLGIVLFSNDTTNGGRLHTIVKWLVLDYHLGLNAIDWNTRIRERQEQEKRKQAEALATLVWNAEPPVTSLKTFEGTYSHPAYGPFVLRWFDSSAAALDIITLEDASAILEWIDETKDQHLKPYGLIRSDKVWAKYMLMRHLSKDTYALTFLVLSRIRGSGKRLVIQDHRKGSVTLASQSLIFGGNFWGADDRELKGELIFRKTG